MSENRREQTKEPLRNVTKPSVSRICARQGCDRLVAKNPRGRPARYCSAACRMATHRERKRGPITAEVHFGSASTRSRREQQSWMVKLRRDHDELIVVIGQTRDGAEHLARRLNDFLN